MALGVQVDVLVEARRRMEDRGLRMYAREPDGARMFCAMRVSPALDERLREVIEPRGITVAGLVRSLAHELLTRAEDPPFRHEPPMEKFCDWRAAMPPGAIFALRERCKYAQVTPSRMIRAMMRSFLAGEIPKLRFIARRELYENKDEYVLRGTPWMSKNF